MMVKVLGDRSKVALYVNAKEGWICLREEGESLVLDRDEVRVLRDYLNNEWVDPDAAKERR